MKCIYYLKENTLFLTYKEYCTIAVYGNNRYLL